MILDVKLNIRFTDDEIISLKQLKEALEIAKGVVKVLGLEDATLLPVARSIKVSFINCHLQCYYKIIQEVCINLFDKFWGTGSHAKQWLIIAK